MADYNEKFLPNAKFEMVHISQEDEDSHEEWAKKENFPWLTINAEKAGEEIRKLGGNSVPSYVMVDLAGNVVAKDKYTAFKKVEE